VEEIEAHIFACCFKWVGYSVSIHLIEYGQARRVETSAAGVESARIGVKQYVAKKSRAQRIHHRGRYGQGPISRKACSINLYIYKLYIYIILYIYYICRCLWFVGSCPHTSNIKYVGYSSKYFLNV
jgi:hypothetical protein